MAHREEDFRPTSGRVVGLLGLGIVAAVVVVDLLDPVRALPAWGWALLVLLAALLWAALLRPRVWVAQGDLVLRTMLETVRIPLAAVEHLTVRQVLVVAAGGRRFTCPGVGQSRRTLVRSDRGRSGSGGSGGGVGAAFGVRSWGGGGPDPEDEAAVRSHQRARGVDYAGFVESRLVELTDRARLEARVRSGSPEQRELAGGVRRVPAWPEIAVLTGSALALVVLLLLL